MMIPVCHLPGFVTAARTVWLAVLRAMEGWIPVRYSTLFPCLPLFFSLSLLLMA